MSEMAEPEEKPSGRSFTEQKIILTGQLENPADLARPLRISFVAISLKATAENLMSSLALDDALGKMFWVDTDVHFPILP